MIVSLLSMQGRATPNTEVAAQLALAAHRVAMVERMHRRLHFLDGVQRVAFKPYLEELCRDFAAMTSSSERRTHIKVDSVDLTLSAATAIPLSFIVHELITNGAKHGAGAITVRVQGDAARGYKLAISNDGPRLPDGFDPATTHGMGLRIVQALAGQIGATLVYGPGDGGSGARFEVLFSSGDRRAAAKH